MPIPVTGPPETISTSTRQNVTEGFKKGPQFGPHYAVSDVGLSDSQ